MKLLNEIRSQPPHIREMFMWLCSIIVSSFIVFVGFRETNKRMVALFNPELPSTSPSAVVKKDVPSPFASISSYVFGLKSSITNILNLDFSVKPKEFKKTGKNNEYSGPKISPKLLPLFKDKD